MMGSRFARRDLMAAFWRSVMWNECYVSLRVMGFNAT